VKTGWIGFVWACVLCVIGLCDGAIVVDSPNGGERLSAGSRRLITWRCDNSVTLVDIEFSFTEGVLWETVAAKVACGGGEGSFLWTVPAISSPRCLIRVRNAADTGDFDRSDSTFTVFPCALRMDYDGDCAVTFADLAGFALEWLHCGDPYDPSCLGNRPPRIVSSPPLQTAVGQLYTYTVRASDPDGDRLTYGLPIAPVGMVIDAAGTISWNAPAGHAGGTTVVVQVRDELGAADIQTFVLDAAILFAGAPADGWPSLFERRVIVYTNAVRMAPQQYRDKYMAGFQPNPDGILAAHSAVEPLYYERRLNEAARAHAQDMADHGCFQHDSCDGTPWATRLRNFYPGVSVLGENIAVGYATAKEMVDRLLCDESGGRCAADHTSQAGHRTNIMDARLRQIGTGYVYTATGTWRHYWVQDFAGNVPATRPFIVAACHDFLASGKTSFLLSYRDETSRLPASIQVIVNGVAHEMRLDLGSGAAGTYRADLNAAGACREYYFVATTASGDLWRYPGPGHFLTHGEGPCTADYQP
jgi:hypothetical protein